MVGLVDFQDEEEVKFFLENLEVECNYYCYYEKDLDGCYWLVDYLEGIQKNFDEVVKVLKFNCEENQYSDSCYKLGVYYVIGKGGLVQDLKVVVRCFLMVCEKFGKKFIVVCYNVGFLVYDGQVNEDGQFDLGKVRDYYIRVCDGGYVFSCFNFSVMFLQGVLGFFKDMDLVCKYFMKVCDLGYIWVCVNVSCMYKLGDGVDKDEVKVEVLKN